MWTNPSPVAKFGVKTLTISGLKNYSYVFVIGILATIADSKYKSIMGGFAPNDIGRTWAISDSNYQSLIGLSNVNFAMMCYRTFGRVRFGYYNGSTQIIIGNAVSITSNDGSGYPVHTNNEFFVPTKII